MNRVGENVLNGGFIERFERRYPAFILETLLCDRTTGRNIIWADNEYEALGEGYLGDDEICVEKITGLNSGVIKPRIAKEQERQSQRTKSRAEVFTPSWLCNRMNNDLDAVWFGACDVFNTEDGLTWVANAEPVYFPGKKGQGWHAYIESRRLEITCGEAPFVCSRYDTVTGDFLSVERRIGFLDRKLRIVTEKTKTRSEWLKQAIVSLKASYGFEYQGDNLLLARINVFETFCEHFYHRWGMGLSNEEMSQVAWIVSWNFWQMDGFTNAIPTNGAGIAVRSADSVCTDFKPMIVQMSLFDSIADEPCDGDIGGQDREEAEDAVPLCVIYDWAKGEPVEFASLKGDACHMGKKFYAVIGNPPYQEQSAGDNANYAPPIYNKFMDGAFAVSDRVELITPARFLFNAGSTPKAWNKRMLDDPCFKVMEYMPDSAKVFPGTDIKGGVAVTYRQEGGKFGPIGIFTPFPELNSICKKVSCRTAGKSLADVIFTQVRFDLDSLYRDYPDLRSVIGSNGRDRRFRNNIFDKVFVFDREASEDSIKVLGVQKNKRVFRYIELKYVDTSHENLDKWKVLVPRANGSGAFGEVLSSPLVAEPFMGYTQSFIGIGSFEREKDASSCMKYIKGKFARALLGVLKITQDNDRGVWKLIPFQDFASDSDIDWSQSISDIDKQLYAKYGLDESEVEFIETHVKEMS